MKLTGFILSSIILIEIKVQQESRGHNSSDLIKLDQMRMDIIW